MVSEHTGDPPSIGSRQPTTAPPREPSRAGRAAPTAAAPGSAVESGTTVVGVTGEAAVVLAADRRASVGGGRFVANKDVRKVERVHPTAAVASSGTMGHIQQFVRTLRAEASLYADRRGDPMGVGALGTLAGTLLRETPLAVAPLLGGVDAGDAHLFGLDGGGGVLRNDYAALGSGMQLAYGVLEGGYAPDDPIGELRGLAARAVGSASERDTASGDGVTIATVTGEAVELEAYDAVAEVA